MAFNTISIRMNPKLIFSFQKAVNGSCLQQGFNVTVILGSFFRAPNRSPQHILLALPAEDLQDLDPILSFFSFLFFFCLFRAAGAAHGGSQARGSSQSCCCRPTPQLMAMPDPPPTERGQGSNLQPHGS